MRLRSLLACSVVLSTTAVAQYAHGPVSSRMAELKEAGVSFQQAAPFERMQGAARQEAIWQTAVPVADILHITPAGLQQWIADGGTYLSLELPRAGGALVLDLQRMPVEEEVRVVLASGAEVAAPPALHYRGSIQGVPGSIAAISVFGNEVMGLISDAEGDMVLGRLAGVEEPLHILYRAAQLPIPAEGGCSVLEMDEPGPVEPEGASGGGTDKCVRFFWEVNYDIFQNKGSVANAVNYITGLFNQTAIVFANDGVEVALQEVFVWDVPSPYTGGSPTDRLYLFGENRTSFNGDLAHLLCMMGGGGVAWLNTLCAPTNFRMAVSDISANYSNVPTYSWSVMVICHEQGHNMGSQHTHACAWNGNSTAIDGCGPTAGYSEGCDAPVPSNGGTIMSYCHLLSTGIDLAHGFGPQPAARIQNRITNATCLGSCAVPCLPPGGLTATGITYHSALIGWDDSGSSTYDLRWRKVGFDWTEVLGIAGTSHLLEGLDHASSYQYQVRSVCGEDQSAWAIQASFSTPQAPCEVAPPILLSVKVFLGGPYVQAELRMHDSLRANELVPLQEPYTAMGFAVTGPLTTTAGVLATTGNNAIVDWVLVRLRHQNNQQPVETRVGLLQRDGDVVAVDGVSPLIFCSNAGNYYVEVRHRNHLACMTAVTHPLNTTSPAIDLTLPATATYGSQARRSVGSRMVLWSGNVVPDGVVRYTNVANDREPILLTVGGTVPTGSVAGYLATDVNMDGWVRYTGGGNDRDPVLITVGGGVPTAERVEQLP